jgi:hypothetical protein
VNSGSRRLQRTVVWRNLFASGSDYCSLWKTADGWRLEGTAIAVLEGAPLLARYVVDCDSQWRTERVAVERTIGSETRAVRLTKLSGGAWRREEHELSGLSECIDVDFAITPATNTLPIRRLNLAVGESAQVTAAWIKFPDLNIEPLPQTYTRLGEDRYLYQSATGFAAEITVDELGLINHYPGGWERVS